MSNEIDMRSRDVLVRSSSLHVWEGGRRRESAILFLHGFPQSASAWTQVLHLACKEHYVLAPDLPGIGRSTGATTDGSKAEIAALLHEVLRALEVREVTLVGHDAGAMIAFAYLREFSAHKVVLMNTVIPGVEPWDAVLRDPRIWHFALHAVPGLPELLVKGKQAAYFDYFFDALAANKAAIDEQARAASVAAYQRDSALSAGFDWYRAFPQDAAQNATPRSITTPVLYLRGDRERLNIEDYVAGLRKVGIQNLQQALIPGAGHFAPQEAPAATWQRILQFIEQG
jgi:pimeloyl-ACP methyl ester carboxylesterase